MEAAVSVNSYPEDAFVFVVGSIDVERDYSQEDALEAVVVGVSHPQDASEVVVVEDTDSEDAYLSAAASRSV